MKTSDSQTALVGALFKAWQDFPKIGKTKEGQAGNRKFMYAPFDEVRRKYGIKGSWTVQRWVQKYGNGTRGKVTRVQKAEEVNEMRQLKDRVNRLQKLLADSHLDLALERCAART